MLTAISLADTHLQPVDSAPEEEEEGRLRVTLLGLLKQQVGSLNSCLHLASIKGEEWPYNCVIPQESQAVAGG